ncbi:MAG: hypothetical protein WC314_05950 [Vulcanimicrobiota bacterium]
MSLQSFGELAWRILVVDGWSVAWRVGLLAGLFFFLGLGILLLCFKAFYQQGFLKLDWKFEKFYEWLILVVWVLGIPCFSIATGTILGAWWAGSHLIDAERLGERIGKVCFRTVAAGVAAAELSSSEQERIRTAEALLRGEEKIAVEDIATYTSHHAGQLTAARLESLIPISSDGMMHAGTVWAVEKCLDTLVYYQLGSEGDAIYKLVNKVAEHDRKTDNDGYVTVEEISDVACETFLDKSVKKIWAVLVLEILIPVVAVFLLLPIVPPLLAGLVRFVGRWWRARKEKALGSGPD